MRRIPSSNHPCLTTRGTFSLRNLRNLYKWWKIACKIYIIHSLKQTYHLKIGRPKSKLVFQPLIIFRGYVSFGERVGSKIFKIASKASQYQHIKKPPLIPIWKHLHLRLFVGIFFHQSLQKNLCQAQHLLAFEPLRFQTKNYCQTAFLREMVKKRRQNNRSRLKQMKSISLKTVKSSHWIYYPLPKMFHGIDYILLLTLTQVHVPVFLDPHAANSPFNKPILVIANQPWKLETHHGKKTPSLTRNGWVQKNDSLYPFPMTEPFHRECCLRTCRWPSNSWQILRLWHQKGGPVPRRSLIRWWLESEIFVG